MGGDQGGSAGSGGGSDGKPLRPQPPILNLKAIEVVAEPTSSEAGSETGSATAASAAEAKPAAAGAPAPPATPAEAQPSAALVDMVTPSDVSARGESSESRQPHEQPPAAPADPVDRGATASEAGAAGNTPHDPPGRVRPWRLAGLAVGAGAGAAAGAAALLAAAWFGGFPIGTNERADETASRIAGLEAQVRALSSRPPPAPDARIGEIATRIATAEQTLAQVKQLEMRLAQAEATLAKSPAGSSNAADPALAGRTAAIEESAKTLTTALAELQKRVAEVATVAQAARDAVARSSGATSANEANLAGGIEGLTKRIQALEETAKALRAVQAAPPPVLDRAARMAAAVLALRPAVESGAPFSDELSALKALGGDSARLAALEPFAASGVPSADSLRRELSQLAATARRSSDDGKENAGFFERLQAGAARLIRIRRVDAPVSTDARDVLGRVEAAAVRGDFAEAVAEIVKLPEALRATLDPWVRRAQGRQAALNTAREIFRAGMVGLAAPSGEPAPR